MDEHIQPPPNFPLLAALFEGSLAVVAVGLGWLLGYPPLATFRDDLYALGLGLLAVAPLLLLLMLCLWVPLRPFSDVLRAVDHMLCPLMRTCSVVELAAIAVLAGFGEEMLFRGVLQAALSDGTRHVLDVWTGLGDCPTAAGWVAILMVAFLFGMAHAVNGSYAVLAGLIGVYLGWLWMASGQLLLPIATHTIYDFLALVYLVKVRRPACADE
jgi:uncharacterized protein